MSDISPPRSVKCGSGVINNSFLLWLVSMISYANFFLKISLSVDSDLSSSSTKVKYFICPFTSSDLN